jgi:hypothetical protein
MYTTLQTNAEGPSKDPNIAPLLTFTSAPSTVQTSLMETCRAWALSNSCIEAISLPAVLCPPWVPVHCPTLMSFSLPPNNFLPCSCKRQVSCQTDNARSIGIIKLHFGTYVDVGIIGIYGAMLPIVKHQLDVARFSRAAPESSPPKRLK